MTRLSRRRFLSDSAVAATVLAAGSGASFISNAAEAVAADTAASPNDKIHVMICGVRSRGRNLMKYFAGNPQCRVRYLCDVDEAIGQQRVDEFEKQLGYRPKFIRDMREGLDDKELHAAVHATPNHWHALGAIWTMQAGKDVYIEKPVSHTIDEGKLLIEATRRHKTICQTGTQARSLSRTIDAINYVRSGKIGDVKLARVLCYNLRKPIGEKGVYQPPKSVDYDLWVGPAEMRPVTRPQFHYDWHWQYHWGNGDINNMGIHLSDIARWGLGINTLYESVISYGGRLGYNDAGDAASTLVSIGRSGDKTIVHEIRGLPTDPLLDAMVGNIFYGTEGTVVVNFWNEGYVLDPDGKIVTQFEHDMPSGVPAASFVDQSRDHIQNFLDAVRSRNPDDLNANIRDGYLSAGLGHVATIAYRLGKQTSVDQVREAIEAFGGADDHVDTLDRTVAYLKKNGVDVNETPMTLGPVLRIDTKTETFIDNQAADAMLTRKYRKGFEVPEPGEV